MASGLARFARFSFGLAWTDLRLGEFASGIFFTVLGVATVLTAAVAISFCFALWPWSVGGGL